MMLILPAKSLSWESVGGKTSCPKPSRWRKMHQQRQRQGALVVQVPFRTEARAFLDVLVLQIVAESCAIDASLIAFLCRGYAFQSNRRTSHDQSSVILLRVSRKPP